VGTGTEIGKTHVSCALLWHLRENGQRICGYKPVESGWDAGEGSDAVQLAQAAGHDLIEPAYALKEPVSPHLAARIEGQQIRLEAVTAAVAKLDAPWVLVETAGGLFSPLSASATNFDMVAAVEATDVVLVAADRLGVLHDTRACLLPLKRLTARLHLVLSAAEQVDASTDSNATELVKLGWVERCHRFPRAAADHADTRAAAEQLVKALSC